jgi:hypothetical protein
MSFGLQFTVLRRADPFGAPFIAVFSSQRTFGWVRAFEHSGLACFRG